MTVASLDWFYCLPRQNKPTRTEPGPLYTEYSPFLLTDVARRKENKDQIDGKSEVSFMKIATVLQSRVQFLH